MSQQSTVNLDEARGSSDPPPLNHYSRTERVKRDIQECLLLSGTALIEKFAQTDHKAPNYRTSEALVFFVRRAIRHSDDREIEMLFDTFKARCFRAVAGKAKGFSEEDRLDILSAVLEKVTQHLFADGKAADYAESRFGDYIQRRVLTAITNFKRDQQKDALLDDFTEDSEEFAEAVRAKQGQARLSPEDLILMHDALNSLPPHFREAYILRHYAGWRVGDERKPEVAETELTLMEYYKIGRRAMHKRLAKAQELLDQYCRKDPA